MTAPRQWLRLYREVARDPKLRRLPVEARWLWIVLLCLANEVGVIEVAPGEPYTEAELAREADVTEKDVAAGLVAFKRLAMISVDKGCIALTHWGERQFTSDGTSGDRVRAFRERQRKGNVTVKHYSETLRAEQSRAEQKKSSSEPRAAAAEPASPVLLVFPTVGKVASWPFTEAMRDEYQALYPVLDVMASARRALHWLTDVKPTGKKTAGGMHRFFTSWLDRAVGKGEDLLAAGGNGKRPSAALTAEDVKAIGRAARASQAPVGAP